MPLDAITLSAVLSDVSKKTLDTRIYKVYQPQKDEIVLSLRGNGVSHKLLISASSSAPRINLLQRPRKNPDAAPMFCMLLRKHLQGAKIVSITQPDMERICIIELDTRDEMGVFLKKFLACEFIGRQSNIILYDNDGRIIDALRRIDGQIGLKRQILPGLFYEYPPSQDKQNALILEKSAFIYALENEKSDMPVEKWLLHNFIGFSPLICREIVFRSCKDTDILVKSLTHYQMNLLCDEFFSFTCKIKSGVLKPYMLIDTKENNVFDFTVYDTTQYGQAIKSRQYDDFSHLLEDFYYEKDNALYLKRYSSDITKIVTSMLERTNRKILIQTKELDDTQKRHEYKKLGDLITANLYKITPGMTKVTVTDYFTDDCRDAEVTLKPELTAQRNAQRYYKLYNKAKNAQTILKTQIENAEADKVYFESVLESIDKAQSPEEFEEIRKELEQTGYIKNSRSKPRANAVSAPYEYKTTDGFTVLAGKNNLQNQMLTFKTAYKTDMWFHAQQIPGSHVVLLCGGKSPSDEAICEAASIAAYHCKNSGLAKIPVDYTQIKNIKKPSAAKPGMVIYHIYNTMYISVDKDKIESLSKLILG